MMQPHPFPAPPDRIHGLAELANNLWWSWHPDARNLFRELGLQPWRESRHNPIRDLAILPSDVLEEAASDPTYLNRYDAVMARFADEISAPGGWFPETYTSPGAPLAYMSAEYGLHESLPTYAGSLGIPAPALMVTLGYFDGLRAARLPANLIQAQRDFFGAHTYERVDARGVFHTEWRQE